MKISTGATKKYCKMEKKSEKTGIKRERKRKKLWYLKYELANENLGNQFFAVLIGSSSFWHRIFEIKNSYWEIEG